VKGFIGGTLLLIALSVAVTPGTADKVAAGTGLLNGMLRRLLSPTVAGLPRLKSGSASTTATATPSPGAVTTTTPVPTTGRFTLV
jgi:hypothetical protein